MKKESISVKLDSSEFETSSYRLRVAFESTGVTLARKITQLDTSIAKLEEHVKKLIKTLDSKALGPSKSAEDETDPKIDIGELRWSMDNSDPRYACKSTTEDPVTLLAELKSEIKRHIAEEREIVGEGPDSLGAFISVARIEAYEHILKWWASRSNEAEGSFTDRLKE